MGGILYCIPPAVLTRRLLLYILYSLFPSSDAQKCYSAELLRCVKALLKEDDDEEAASLSAAWVNEVDRGGLWCSVRVLREDSGWRWIQRELWTGHFSVFTRVLN